jgi:hypothetical protein
MYSNACIVNVVTPELELRKRWKIGHDGDLGYKLVLFLSSASYSMHETKLNLS